MRVDVGVEMSGAYRWPPRQWRVPPRRLLGCFFAAQYWACHSAARVRSARRRAARFGGNGDNQRLVDFEGQ